MNNVENTRRPGSSRIYGSLPVKTIHQWGCYLSPCPVALASKKDSALVTLPT